MSALELVAFDLDGTVFASPFVQKVSERVGCAFTAAARQGVTLVVCSGRPGRMLGPCLPQEPWLSWAILTSGALVTPYGGAATQGATLERPMPNRTSAELMRVVRDAGCYSMIHTAPASYADRGLVELLRGAIKEGAGADKGAATDGTAQSDDANRGNYGLGAFGSCKIVESALDAFCADGEPAVFKLDVACPGAKAADRLEPQLRALPDLAVARTNPGAFEITAANATKGAALDWLCAELGIDPAHAVAFGDSANDLPLAGHAGTFVAMGNAAADVKAAADEVCKSVLDDGVARWLEAHL